MMYDIYEIRARLTTGGYTTLPLRTPAQVDEAVATLKALRDRQCACRLTALQHYGCLVERADGTGYWVVRLGSLGQDCTTGERVALVEEENNGIQE